MPEARVPCLAHNVLLHGAEKLIPGKENSSFSNKAGINKSKENTNTSTHAPVSDVHDIESSKGLLPTATLGVSSDVTSLLTYQAALLATHLKDDMLTALTVNINQVYMWTDSTTVLQWLNSSDKLPALLANRVGEILESTTLDKWHHVLMDVNPANTDTRGTSLEALNG